MEEGQESFTSLNFKEAEIVEEIILFKEQEKDVLSTLFEKEVPSEERYDLGQYFTHKEIVNFIVDSIPIKREDKILDPTCGAGAFLKNILSKNKINPENIYGVDIDKRALKLCKENISHKSKNMFLGDFINEDLFKENYFDVIIGNPPFKNLKFNNKDFPLGHKYYQEITSGSTNFASLVLSKSYFLLKDGGYLGLVLPKNFIRVDSFKKIREFIINNMKIILIKDLDHHFKDVRCDQIILIAQKKKTDLTNKVNIIPYKKGCSFLNNLEYTLTQKEFLRYSFFPLFYNENVKLVADKLFSIKQTLSNEANIFRGESLISLKKYISDKQTRKDLFLLRGNCIKRFGIKNRLFLNKEFSKELLNGRSKTIFQNKIVIQNLASKEGGIFSAISDEHELTLDTVTNIIPNNKDYILFLTGLLSSRLCNFFMIHLTYLNSNFSMHTDKAYIGKLPIIYPDRTIKEKIDLLVSSLLSIEDKYSSNFKEEYAQLNNILYRLYGLNKKEVLIIENSLKEVMSKKHG
ncbi:MAG: N-6 DNA methylase [archaeon]